MVSPFIMILMKDIRVINNINLQPRITDMMKENIVLIGYAPGKAFIKTVNLFKIGRCNSRTEMITYCPVNRMIIPGPLTVIRGPLS